jgi:hypothetical protein
LHSISARVDLEHTSKSFDTKHLKKNKYILVKKIKYLQENLVHIRAFTTSVLKNEGDAFCVFVSTPALRSIPGWMNAEPMGGEHIRPLCLFTIT